MNICCYRYFERQSRGNPNRVSNVTDNSGSNLGYPNTSGSFTYDASGNQITYGAKGITSITYNHLNLPTKYTWSGSNLEIQYDAAGRKLKKIPSTGNAKTYVGNIEYSGTSIEAIYHSEGRARLISSTWEYEYAIRDHLSNARVYFKYNGTVTFLQESHYYPFGMEQGGWTSPVSPENKYKYNGKEYNDDFSLGLYDYGARWYDPVVGRWGQVDPLSEKFLYFTPFNYTNNNPINFIDPDGNSTAPPRTADDSKNDANGAAMFGDAPFNEYERIRHADGTVTTRQISDKGGDAQDIIHHTNGYPIPHAKYSGYTVTVNNTTGGQRIAPGVFANRLASGQISPVDDPVSAIEKGGANFAVWGLFSILKKGGKEVTESAAKTGGSWAKTSGILRDASKGKGNYALGSGTYNEAMLAGRSWVGEGFTISKDGSSWISANGLRQFRSPSFKPKHGIEQANFQWRNIDKGAWQSNGHLDIIKP